jgi:hypothetical protein
VYARAKIQKCREIITGKQKVFKKKKKKRKKMGPSLLDVLIPELFDDLQSDA